MDVRKRLLEIADAVGIKNLSKMADELDCAQSNISHLIKSGKFNESFISRLRRRWPCLSEEFIRHGMGDPIDPSRQADLDRETLIALICRNFDRLEPAAQSILLDSAKRIADKKNVKEPT